MQITLYSNFKKRINSTKQPTGGTNINMTLKRPTSIENPVFILENSNIVEAANYVRWGDHYYFISNKTYINNDMVEVACSQDVLATYKSDIGSTSTFVEYATTGFNADILDPRISNTGAVTRATNSATPTNIFISGGRYILSVIGKEGVADRYMITEAQLKSLGAAISNANDTVAEEVSKRYGNFTNCIVGLRWIPYTMGAGVLEEISLGTYATGVNAIRKEPSATAHDTVNITIPWVSSSNGRKARETMTLYLPGFGTTTLDTSTYMGVSTITIDIIADVTGSITYALHNPGGTIDYFNANVGADIPVTSFTQSPVGMLASPTSKLAGFFAKEFEASPLLNQALSAASTIIGNLGNTGSNVACIGGQGSISSGLIAISNNTIYLTNKSFNYSEDQEDMATNYGRPVFAIKTLSTLSGYIKCNGASVNIEGFEDDKNAVNAFLNSGFFYE